MPHVLSMVLAALLQAADPSAEGLKALEANNYASAAQLFAKAVEADPKDYAARFNLALANSLLGNRAEAIAGYKATLELKPGLYEAEMNLGILLQGAEALPWLEEAVKQKPQEFRPNFYLAEALYAAGDFAQAEKQYTRSGELDPKSAVVQFGLARSLMRQDKLDEAAAALDRAAALEPSYAESALELGPRYEQAGKPDKALQIYERFPANPAAVERRAVLLIKEKKPAEAAPLLVQLLAKEPGNVGLRLTYGRVLRDLKKYPQAASEFARVVQAMPDLVEGWGEFAAMLILLEDYPRALAALDRPKALGAEAPGHLYLRAIIYDKTRQLKPALECYQKFLAASQGKSPDEEFLARQRARILKSELDRK